MASGKPQKQAIAIALSVARKGSGHKSFAAGVDAFDPRSLAAGPPPAASIPRGTTVFDTLPRAVGNPPLARFDSNDNMRANYQTFNATDSRAQTSPLRATRAGVATFEPADTGAAENAGAEAQESNDRADPS